MRELRGVAWVRASYSANAPLILRFADEVSERKFANFATALRCDSATARRKPMRVIKQSSGHSYKELYTERYEFRLCGGSVDPSTRAEKRSEGKKNGK